MKLSTSHLRPVTITSSYRLISAEWIWHLFLLLSPHSFKLTEVLSEDSWCQLWRIYTQQRCHNLAAPRELPVSQTDATMHLSFPLAWSSLMRWCCHRSDPMLAGREKRILTENDGKWRLRHDNFDCRVSGLKNVESVGSDCRHS